MPLGAAGRHGEVNAALVRLVDIGSIPVHLDSASTLGRALGSQIGGHLDGEVLLAGRDGHRVTGVHIPLGEIGGDDGSVVSGQADDGDVGGAGVRSDDGEGQGYALAGGVLLDVADSSSQ